MKKLLFVCSALVLLVPVGLFASGQSEGPAAREDGPTEPQYGGTFTYYEFARDDPPSPNIDDGQYFLTRWIAPIAETPVIGDIETYGPKGSGEYAFQALSYVPPKYLTGNLLESWELFPNEMRWHVRPGIHFAADNVDFMDNRELTGADVAAYLERFLNSPWAGRFEVMEIGEIRTDGRYTVVIEFGNYSHDFMYFAGYEDRAFVIAPEVVDAGPDKWENQVGTGPWMFEEWVIGSHMSYVRNPNYRKTTTIDGVEYQLPFIDRVVLPIIPDTSTQIAALRTGRLDRHNSVPTEHQQSLERTTPGLLSAPFTANVTRLVLNTKEPPFDDVNVRRAMMIGTDIEAFRRLAQMEEQPLHSYPANPYDPSIYTPIEELPEEAQILYDYDPDLAKQMLADAGYPDGLDVEFWVAPTPTAQDLASLLQDVWSKIGVNVIIQTHDEVTLHQYRTTGTFRHVTHDGMPISNPLPIVTAAGRTGGTWNYGGYSNPEFDEIAAQIGVEPDVAEMNRMYREAFLILLNDVVNIPLHLNVGRSYWWPWLRNYHGEFSSTDDQGFSAVLPFVWIDEHMKSEMGF